MEVPVINISSLLSASNEAARLETVRKIGDACRQIGFFYIVGHNVDLALQQSLDDLSHKFFSLPLETKNEIAMKYGGKAWRGFFPVGDENTSGIPDQKEGIYFGTELPEKDTRLLHGPNLWPNFPDSAESIMFREYVLEYMRNMQELGLVLMKAIAESLGIQFAAFTDMFTNPTELFRIFNYPPHDEKYGASSFGVGEHTDYGFITLLRQDSSGGLQVKRCILNNEHQQEEGQRGVETEGLHVSGEGNGGYEVVWVDVPPIDNSFVVNIGDALEGMTGGLLRATPHRVLQRVEASNNRLSFPYFYDPNFDATMFSLFDLLSEEDKLIAKRNQRLVSARWDNADPTKFQGKYGDYLSSKVAKVFPELSKQVSD